MTTTMTPKQKAESVRDYAAQCNGSENLYRHFTRRIVYTDGIKYLADTCGAHWLVDAVASHQSAAAWKRVPAETQDFQVWRLRPVRDGWELDCWTDTPDDSTRMILQRIEYSDFPRELCEGRGFEFWVEHGVMLLKEER